MELKAKITVKWSDVFSRFNNAIHTHVLLKYAVRCGVSIMDHTSTV